MTIRYEFVDLLPPVLEDNVLYISIENAVAIHRCFCGCGTKINTPISRRHGWVLSYDGDTVSLSPSIGSRSLPCQSHYWIEQNKVTFLGWYNVNAQSEFADKKKRKKKNKYFSLFKK